MLNSVEECACKALDERLKSSRRNLVIVTARDKLKEVNNMVAASLPPGSSCTGTIWRDPEGRTIRALAYEDPPPSPEEGGHPYDVEVCNAGVTLTPTEIEHLKRWRGVK